MREDAIKGVYVEGLAEMEVTNTMDAMDVLRRGIDNRRVESTNMNRVSSRSHAMFVLTVKSELFSENGTSKVRMSKFTLVDLAGSERQKSTAADGDRLKEACNINNSLLCLGNVINSLVDREKGKMNHVKFRDSKLTFLLRDSWGGNSKTCLVATVTPSLSSISETISTLKFAQRAKLVKNRAVLNENTCGSVSDLQAEVARLRVELELKNGSQQQVHSGDQPSIDQGLPPLAPRPSIKPAYDAIVSALRNQNSKLSKKVKVLNEVSIHREILVNSLKRKVQQETLIRKCKERRITYLSNKGKTSGIEDNDEVAALREEIAVLQEQLQAQPCESVEWMLKYKEEKAKVEEMEVTATDQLEYGEKNELESSIVLLLDEKDSLQQKVDEMANQRNVEIDAIINDVTTLENSNVMLQSQLDEKVLTIKAHEKTIQGEAIHIEELRKEIKATLDRLEMTQRELEAGMQKTAEIQESFNNIKIELQEANESTAEHQHKAAVARNDLDTMTKMHDETMTALNIQISVLQQNLTKALKENESLQNELQEVSNNLQSKMIEFQNLDFAMTEAMRNLELKTYENDANVESFKLREEALMAEIEKMKEISESIIAEKCKAIDMVTAQNNMLLIEVECLKTQEDTLKHRISSSDQIRDIAAALEDEITLINIENSRIVNELEFVESDFERTIRLQDHLRETELDALSFELAISEANNNCLLREKYDVQKKLTNVISTLSKSTDEYDEKIRVLESDITVLRENVDLLEVEKKTAEVLREEHAQTTLLIEEITVRSNTLSAFVETLRVERDELQQAFKEKTAQLETELADALESCGSFKEQLLDVSHDLQYTKAQLHTLQEERNEVSNQMLLFREKHNADIESFKLKEESMAANISNANKTIESLLAQKADTIAELERTTVLCTSLTSEVDTMKSKMLSLQERCETLSTVEDEFKRATIEKAAVEERFKASESNLERTIADLAAANGKNDVIVTLQEEKLAFQNEVADISKKLAEKESLMSNEIEMLVNESECVKPLVVFLSSDHCSSLVFPFTRQLRS